MTATLVPRTDRSIYRAVDPRKRVGRSFTEDLSLLNCWGGLARRRKALLLFCWVSSAVATLVSLSGRSVMGLVERQGFLGLADRG
jgi:hypothetical protein